MSRLVPPRPLRSLLAAEDLSPWISEAYALEGPLGVTLLAAGDHDLYGVETGERRLVLRVYADKPWPCGLEDYRFELDWLEFLAARGVPVCPPLRRRDGELLGVIPAPEGERFTALFRHAPGQADPLPSRRERRRAFGRALAELHRASASYRPRHRRFRIDRHFLLERPAETLRGYLTSRRPALWEPLAELIESAGRRLATAGLTTAAEGVILGDAYGGNHHFVDDRTLAFFDCDLCGPGWWIHDLATARWHAERSLPEDVAAELFADVLTAYRETRPLSAPELAALPLFVSLRQLWLMGEHVLDIPLWGEARLDDAYWRQAWSFLAASRRRWDAPGPEKGASTR